MKNLRIEKGTPIDPQQRNALPEKFTNPFSYVPHEITLQAMESLCAFIKGQMPYSQQQLQQDGKMMGAKKDERGYIEGVKMVDEGDEDIADGIDDGAHRGHHNAGDIRVADDLILLALGLHIIVVALLGVVLFSYAKILRRWRR